jgi:hypothetical protein
VTEGGVTAGRPPLFTSADKLRVGVLLAAGAVVIVLSWFFAAGRSDAGDQLLFVSLSLVGALLGMAATAGLLLRGRRIVGARTQLLLGTAPAAPTDTLVSAELVAGPDAKWFHRSDCLLVEGRQWPPAPLAAHLGAGRKPCPACRPAPRSEGQPA